MVQVNGGDDADLHIGVVPQLLGNGGEGNGLGLVHVNHAAVGLEAGGDGRSGGGGVGAEGRGIVGGGVAHAVELHKVQGHVAVQNAVVIGVRVGALESGSQLELGIGHAVADEQEDILGRVAFRRRSGRGAKGQGAEHSEGQNQRCHASVELFHV